MSATTTNPLRNRRRWWATRLVILVLFFAALSAAYRYVLAQVVAAKLEAIRRAGYPVTLAELDKWYPQTPAGKNGAEVFGVAFAKLMEGPSPVPLSRVVPADLASHATPLSEAVKQAVASLLASNAEAVALLHEGAASKRSRYPLDLGRLTLLPYPHLMNLHRSAYLLELEAIGSADQQNPELAARSVQSLLGLAASLTTEPLVRSHLARIECQKIAVSSLQSVFNKTVLSDSELGSLTVDFNEADKPECLARAFAGQRCIGVCGFDMMTETMDFSKLPSGRRRPWWQQVFIALNLYFISPEFLSYPSGLVQWDKLRYLQFMDQYVTAAEADFPDRLASARSLQRALRQLPRFYVFTGQWLRAMNGTGIILRDASTVARLRAARTATAIERFRLAHGEPPETLAALTPTYLKTVPTDPFDPASTGLRYKKLTKGYIVYSVGEDGHDDGGDAEKDIPFAVER